MPVPLRSKSLFSTIYSFFGCLTSPNLLFLFFAYRHFVLAVIKECRDLIERMYVEVPQNLADFDDYVPFSPITSSANYSTTKSPSDNAATWSWAGYRNKNNALCDADRQFVRPSVAQDITGRWFVIVQSSLYHQQIPTELCR